MKYLLALVAAVATSCVLFAGDRTECYLDAAGNVRCRVVRDATTATPTVATAEAPAAVSASPAGCTNCGCQAAMTESARAVLFPGVRSFVSTVIENRLSRVHARRAFFFAAFRR